MSGNSTPGPWTAHECNDGAARWNRGIPITAGCLAIARAFESRLLQHGEANARLIAAAPDLLDACEKALSCMAPEDNDVTAQALRAAIAKARA